MSIAAQLVDLLLTRHRLNAVKPHINTLLEAVAGLLCLMVFAMAGLALLTAAILAGVFAFMADEFGLMAAGLLTVVLLGLLVATVVWGLGRLIRRARAAFERAAAELASLPGEKTVTSAVGGSVSKAIGVFKAFRAGLGRGKDKA